jgi:signal transduction histidine kinase
VVVPGPLRRPDEKGHDGLVITAQPLGFRQRARMTGYAAEQVLWFPVLLIGMIVTAVGAGLSLIVVGLPVLEAGMALNRAVADRHRELAARVTGVRLPEPHRRERAGGWLMKLWARAEDPMTWRELLWTLVAGTVGFALSLTVVLLFVTVVGGLIWWFVTPALMGLRSVIDRALLHYNRSEQLEVRVAELTQTRAEVVDHSAAELRRIERDLHDGAQARLVALSMTLGMADGLYETSPEQARKMVKEARASSLAALSDLRSLVRGIHPPVLADRGLAGAVQAMAIDLALPVATTIDLDGRPPAPVETAVYFAIAEALANIGKHAAARNAWVTLSHDGSRLRAVIGDDGGGGADPAAGTGLRGVATRLAAFDGTMWVSSPAAGPTLITLEVPCVLSSPRTSPSSGSA